MNHTLNNNSEYLSGSSEENIAPISVNNTFLIKEHETKELHTSLGRKMRITLTRIEVPTTNVPGNRNIYYFLLDDLNTSETLRFDSYDSGKIQNYSDFSFFFTSKSDNTQAEIVIHNPILQEVIDIQ
ncbi:hypothetical protein KBD33_01335 [Candidatus Gracilibacteria bacterium]|nr:hypothetical protein [Candidatus Gracilibacteria bacterium]